MPGVRPLSPTGSGPAAVMVRSGHLVREYARHLGHLGIVSELAGTTSGE
ncbi:hypothetical protein [Trebonia sp.]|nr:hypothetical protein [Trebonia sp.]